uniref:PKD domain-containing protein n=1 Tax=uncultured Methanosarcinales archaeon TaxID=183757 RepID=A0A7H1KNE0_9EURY|nr:hypothetical protein EKMJPAOO_00004 [uncultured Methanosarcinales archaeon]
MNKHRITSDERAVSGLVGEVLLIGIVIVAIGLIAVSVYSYLNKGSDTPHIEVDGVANIGTNEIHIKHQGGDSIECENLRVLVNVNGTLLDPYDDDSPDRWGLRDKGIGNFDRWALGSILVLDTMPEVNITDDDEIRVTIVSLSASRVVVSGEVFGGLFGNASINMIPIADAGDDLTDGLCENTTWAEVWVWFNGSGSYDPDNPTGGIYRGIVSWHWDFGDDNESDVLDEPYVWHNYSADGNYTVTLTVTDVDGATDTDTCIVTIRPPEPLSADAGPDQWVGLRAEVRFDGSGSTGCIKEWQWEFGDGDDETVNASTTTHVYSEEGNYTVNLTVVEDHSNKTANDTATVHVVENGFKIVNPADGAWVSGTELIEAHVIGMEGSDHTDFSIRSVPGETNYSMDETDDSGEVVTLNTTSYTCDWNTIDRGCGNYTINATAYNAGGTEMGTDQITVCVCNIPGLVGFWRFDDGTGSRAANDSSCNRNHGVIHGSPAWIAYDTLYNNTLYALRFNGSSDYVEVANSTSLAMTNKTTIDAWVNSSDAGEQYILAKGDMVFELGGEGDEVVGQNVSNLSWLPGFCGNLKRAQTFNLADDATLNEVRVYINKTDDWAAGDVKVRICTDNGTQPGTEITNATISAAGVNTVYAWHNTSFDCTLTGGTTYWLVLESDRNNWYDYHWGAGSNSTYPGYYPDGKAWYYNGSSWLTDGPGGVWGVDMTFELSATPVPSTYTDRISMPDPDNFKFLIYYNDLNVTAVNWSESGLKMILIADDNYDEIQKVRNAGVDVYFYIELGIDYCTTLNKSAWEQGVKDFISNHPYVDGFVLDDLDSDYWNGSSAYWNNASMCSGCSIDDFNDRLTRINEHVHSNETPNQKTIANGVRYYANHNGSDYYMWESFMSTYNFSVYHYDDFFNGTAPSGYMWSDDPTVWINGVKKYEYLNASGVLNKTLAHCYGPPDGDTRSIYGYIASRVLGLKGFSYADSGNFATEPLRIAEGLKWDLGTRMNYSVDADAGNLSGRFTNGAVVDCVNQTVASNNAIYTTDLISDPLTAHLLDSSSRVTGLDFCLIRGQVDFMHGVLRSSSDLTEWGPGYHLLNATLDAESGTAALYINHTLAAERTFPNGLPFDFTGSNLIIGTNNAGAYGFFNGSIEEVLIYDS